MLVAAGGVEMDMMRERWASRTVHVCIPCEMFFFVSLDQAHAPAAP
jgi:hypothetical protein